MTPNLRIWHRFLWPLLSLVIIGIGVVAVKALPDQPTPEMGAKTVGTIAEVEGLSITLTKGNATTPPAIEVGLSQSLRIPALLLYLSAEAATPISDSRLLGRVEQKGRYSFPLDSIAAAMPKYVIQGVDPIYKKTIFQTPIQ